MKIADTKRALKEMLAGKVYKLNLQAVEFYNQCHDDAGRFCEEGEGGGPANVRTMNAEHLVSEKAHLQGKNLGTDKVSRERLKEISTEQRRRDSGGKQESASVSAPKTAAPSKTAAPASASSHANPREGKDFSVVTRKPDGSPESVRYTGPELRPLEAGYVPKLSDKELNDINTKENRGYDGKMRAAEYQGEAVFVKGNGWVPPYPHDFYKLSVAGVADILTKKDSAGVTGLDHLLRDTDTIDFRGGKPGSGRNDLYIYDGKSIGIPFKIAVAIDTSSGKIATIAPRNATLKEARDLVISGGHDPGNEIVNIKTSAGRARMAKLNGNGSGNGRG